MTLKNPNIKPEIENPSIQPDELGADDSIFYTTSKRKSLFRTIITKCGDELLYTGGGETINISRLYAGSETLSTNQEVSLRVLGSLAQTSITE